MLSRKWPQISMNGTEITGNSTVYVENDFLFALVKPDDWLQEEALEALEEREDIHTSIVGYTELLVLAYDRQAGEYTIDVARAVGDLVQKVPVRPEEHEQAVLTAAVLADEHGFTPFDAIHAGIAIATEEAVLSSEQDYEDVEIDRVPLEPEDD